MTAASQRIRFLVAPGGALVMDSPYPHVNLGLECVIVPDPLELCEEVSIQRWKAGISTWIDEACSARRSGTESK